jgi:DNA-binding MarR family transcriptional regulator/N-acetylglutamate synthase-like GNAT family acetyltransferase
MTHDILRDMGAAFMGSRLKRLGERMQAGAARVLADVGLPMQPSHMQFLVALDDRTLTIGQLVQAVGVSQPGVTRAIGQLTTLGLVRTSPGRDLRQRTISLTEAGAAALARAKVYVWPPVGRAVEQLLSGGAGNFVEQIAELEDRLSASSLDVLVAEDRSDVLTIHEFSDALANHFRDINVEWISSMFRVEDTDREVLDNPREKIINPGGAILFVEAHGLGIVGTCALQKTGACSFELTKMGVREAARGLKAGEFLLKAIVERARLLGADPLYLLTNTRCSAAIHLYEKLGFSHDREIMEQFGSRYERCDVAMRLRQTDFSET